MLFGLAAMASAAPAPDRAEFTSLARPFDNFATSAAGASEQERSRRFNEEVASLLPDFYKVEPAASTASNRRIAAAVQNYPAIRPRFLEADRMLERRHRPAGVRFRAAFPDFRTFPPVYVVHSLGELDGGTRLVGGRVALIFGADVIAELHDRTTIGPLFDHELFHAYHRALLGECEAVWCLLWAEGLATYVASRMNPKADDRALLLSFPRPIRPALQGREVQAACLVLAMLDSTGEADLRGLFASNGSIEGMPPRVGYFIGFRIAAELGKKASLQALAHLDRGTVRQEMERVLRSWAQCADGLQE